MIISDKPGNEMKFHEIPIWDNEKNFQIKYSRASKMLCIVGKIYLKFDECRGPQMMPSICRATWAIVEVVEPSWAAWTPCKIAKNVADQ